MGIENTAVGFQALLLNITGANNTATGSQALLTNFSDDNTANGSQALMSNVNGSFNTATGMQALIFNTDGDSNTACGFQALFSNDTGSNNTAVGRGALLSNIGGSNNIALGLSAGANLNTGSDNIDIGNPGVSIDSGTIRIGSASQTKTVIAGINGVSIAGTGVVVNTSGQLGVVPSSRRFKDHIEPMDKASEAILALNPVTFRYKKDIDPVRTPQFGLVAEDVERVNPALVVRDKEGKAYSVRYDQVNAMLLNEFLKEHKAFVAEQHKVQQLEANAARQEANIAQQQKQIAALTAGLQKVSAQLEVSKAAPQTALNNQ
jgi:hypothetical protein